MRLDAPPNAQHPPALLNAPAATARAGRTHLKQVWQKQPRPCCDVVGRAIIRGGSLGTEGPSPVPLHAHHGHRSRPVVRDLNKKPRRPGRVAHVREPHVEDVRAPRKHDSPVSSIEIPSSPFLRRYWIPLFGSLIVYRHSFAGAHHEFGKVILADKMSNL